MFKAGFAQASITPEHRTVLCGYRARREKARGTHDELNATCAVLSDGNKRIALFSLDLVGVAKDISDSLKSILSKRTGIKPDNILIACTHTHSGPDTIYLFGAGDDIQRYCRQLKDQIPILAEKALSKMVETRVSIVQTEVPDIAFNRRLLLKDGRVVLNLSAIDEKDIQERGVTDPEATAVLFENDLGFRGAIINFALHATVLGEENYLFSRDYPGYLVDYIRDKAKRKSCYPFFQLRFGKHQSN